MTFRNSTLLAARSFHWPVVACLFLLFGGASARGAFYEFTLTGTVTAAPSGDVHIGDPFTVRYVVDSVDLDASVGGGLYAAGNATVTFPSGTLTTGGNPFFGVAQNGGTSVDLLQYLAHDDVSWGANITFSFPAATLTIDALPLTLPLSDANFAHLHIFWAFVLHDTYQGTVSSYASIEVPEPSCAALALIQALTMTRATRRWLRRVRRTV